jgi:hypothetical protein
MAENLKPDLFTFVAGVAVERGGPEDAPARQSAARTVAKVESLGETSNFEWSLRTRFVPAQQLEKVCGQRRSIHPGITSFHRCAY